MTTWSLEIDFDQNGLQQVLQSGQEIVLARPPNGGPAGQLPVVWLAIRPSMSNTVTWTDDYRAFASSTNLTPGVQIVANASDPAQAGNVYTIENFSWQTSPGQPGVITLANGGMSSITMGLEQSAVVGGANAGSNPISAASVMGNVRVDFPTSPDVAVFIGSNTRGGEVLNGLPSGALTVSYDGGTTSHQVRFDDGSGRFVLVS